MNEQNTTASPQAPQGQAPQGQAPQGQAPQGQVPSQHNAMHPHPQGQIAHTDKSRTTAAIFAFFLGGLGGHRFYLGDTGKAIAMLLFCWTGIPGIIALIDFIKYLTMSDEKFAMYANEIAS